MTTPSSPEFTCPARAPETITVEFEGETLVYHRGRGEVHRLDAVGAIVWRFLDGRATVDELVADLASAFRAGQDTVRAGVGSLLERLGQGGLLEGAPEAEPVERPRLLTNPPSP